MYDFGTLIQILLGIISIYIALYFYLKQHANNNRIFMKQEKTLNIIAFFTIYIFIFLYLIPYIIKLIKLLNDNFFNNSNFIFSYITEMILSIIAFIGFFHLLVSELDIDLISEKHNLIIVTLISVLCEIGLLWINYYLSLLISQKLVNNYIFYSIGINIFVYILIFIPIMALTIPCTIILDTINDGF